VFDPATPSVLTVCVPHLDLIPQLGYIFSSHDVPVDANLDGSTQDDNAQYLWSYAQ
jgi:hypothetical protein